MRRLSTAMPSARTRRANIALHGYEPLWNIAFWRPQELAASKEKQLAGNSKLIEQKRSRIITPSQKEVFLDHEVTRQRTQRLMSDLKNAVSYYQKRKLAFNEEDVTLFVKRTSRAISMCWRNNLLQEAVDLFQCFLQTGLRVDVVIITAIIPVFAQVNDLNKILGIFEVLRQENAEVDVILFNSLLTACARCGSLEHADDFFKKAAFLGVQPDIGTYNALLHAKITLGPYDDALRFFYEILSLENVKADEITYNTVACEMMRRKDFEKSAQICRMMTEAGIRPSGPVSNALIAALCEGGRFEEAWNMLMMLKGEGLVNKVTYTSLLKGCSEWKTMDRVMMIYEMMIEEGHYPDVISIGAFINAAAKQNSIDAARFFFEEMISRKIAPDRFVFTLIMNAEAKFGDISRAEQHFREVFRFGRPTKCDAHSIMMDAYVLRRLFDKAAHVCRSFLGLNIPADLYILNSAIQLLVMDPSVENAHLVSDVVKRLKVPLRHEQLETLLLRKIDPSLKEIVGNDLKDLIHV